MLEREYHQLIVFLRQCIAQGGSCEQGVYPIYDCDQQRIRFHDQSLGKTFELWKLVSIYTQLAVVNHVHVATARTIRGRSERSSNCNEELSVEPKINN